MERSTILRWLIIGIGVWLAMTYLPGLWGGGSGGSSAVGAWLGPESVCSPHAPCAPETRSTETSCTLEGTRFRAQFSSHGASLKHLWLEGARYTNPDGSPIDLVTTPDVEQRRPLRFDFRQGITKDNKDSAQVPYDAIDWELSKNDKSSCVFTYKDASVELEKTIRATGRPFELELAASVKNLADANKRHQLGVEVDAWRTDKEVESSLGRQSPHITDVSCRHDNSVRKLSPSDFEPSDFKNPEYASGWFVQSGNIQFASVSDFYFSQALIAENPPASACKLQIEERWNAGMYADKKSDPHAGSMYRALLSWDPKDLKPGDKADYVVVAFMGPKERDVLAAAASGNHGLSELVDLGTFSIIAKYLLKFLVWLHLKVGNWGLAIILMTICVRLILFPLTWKSIQSGFSMRKLKPEIDAINAKFKDDPQQKNLATMELWKKHKVNPLGGCLPAVFQLPVWFALYTSLQTAVELYHTPFLWFKDLTAPDPYYVLPIVLGGTMILQQRLMPMQMDPVQQKMMTYVMPLVFTFMMLFLPSGLAVYMLTNAIIGIAQQVAIEKYWGGVAPASASGTGISVREKPDALDGGKKSHAAVRKG